MILKLDKLLSKSGFKFNLRCYIKEKTKIYLVLEYCAGGDVSEFIRRSGRATEATARHFMIQIAAGLQAGRPLCTIHLSVLDFKFNDQNPTVNPPFRPPEGTHKASMKRPSGAGVALHYAPQRFVPSSLAEHSCGDMDA